MVDFRQLMYWVDNWRNSEPGEIDGEPLVLVGVQTERRISKLWKKTIKNWIYQIGDSKMIVYKEFPSAPAVMKMGVSGNILKRSGDPYHKKAVPLEFYYDVFVAHPIEDNNIAWRKRNDYLLMM